MPVELNRYVRVLVLVHLLGVSISGCTSVPPTDRDGHALLRSIEASLNQAVRQYAAMDETLPDSLFPKTVDPDGTLRTSNSAWWTSGFFPGSLWYLSEYAGDTTPAQRALARTGRSSAKS